VVTTEPSSDLLQRTGPVILHVTTEIEPEWDADVNKWYDEEHVPELMSVPGFISARRYEVVDGAATTIPQKYLCIYEMANEQVVLDRSYLSYHTGWKGAPSLRSEWTDQSSQHYRTHRSVRRQVFPIAGTYTDRSGEGSRAPVPAVGSNMDDIWIQPIGSAVLHVTFTPDPEWEPQMIEWFDEVQVPAYMACPGFLSMRRFLLRYDEDRGEPSVVGHHKYLALYQLQDETAVSTEEFLTAKKRLDVALEGRLFASTAVYKQSFPPVGSFEDRRGPNAQRRERPA
jgi:hypothetical protein